MGVRIDAARHDVAAAGLDGLGARRRFQVLADGGDPVAVQKHVGAEAAVGVHDGSAPDQNGHLGLSQTIPPARPDAAPATGTKRGFYGKPCPGASPGAPRRGSMARFRTVCGKRSVKGER